MVEGVQQTTTSFIEVTESGEVQVDQCNFTNIYSLGYGSVLLAGQQKSIAKISNSVFSNNSAIIGGVFKAEYDSVIQ